jgi:hypothetical protein
MATITSAAIGNWSAGATWVGGVAPTTGDTAILAHNVTVDVNVSVGTSPNDSTTAAITLNTGRTLTIAAGVTLTCLGNQSWTSGAGLVMGAGSQLVFDNSASGGSPVYRIIGSGVYTLNAVGTSGSPCGISAIAGQSWEFWNGSTRYIAFSAVTATSCAFTRMAVGSQAGFQVFSGTTAVLNCTFDGGGTTHFYSTSGSVTLTVDGCRWQNGSYSANGAIKLELATARSSGTRRFNGNVVDGAFTYVSKDFTIQGNYFRGILPIASSSYSWASFRLNFVHATGTENSGNGQNAFGASRNYWVVDNSTGNGHFVSALALTVDCLIEQNVFEAQYPDLVDTGDCVIVNAGATSGSYKVKLRNNITVPASAGQQTGQLLTIYNNATSVSEHERNTVNVNDTSIVGVGKRAAFAFAEAGNGASGQIAVLKGNLVHGTSASQGFIAERIQGTVKDIITAAGADYNWRYNTSDGDNGRGYTDRGGNADLWTAGNAAAAGVDNNQGSGDPGFVAVTRTSVSWAVARGYGSAFTDVVTAIKAVPSRTADLINYIFEGNKPTAAGCRNAAHDGACVGAANWHDVTRSLTAMQATVTELSTNWLT